tara:strand:- start:251 stop:430 length:180 start_codon:yes stop_codon:yes gene_type:complete
MTIEFGDWWYKNENRTKTEKLYGKRASAICDRVDPNLKVDNIYTDVLEKLAIKYSLHLT